MTFEDYVAWIKYRLETELDSVERGKGIFLNGVNEEAGELSGKIKRLYRGDEPTPSVEDLQLELGDTLWYYVASVVLLSNVELTFKKVQYEEKCSLFAMMDATADLNLAVSKTVKVLVNGEEPDSSLIEDFFQSMARLAQLFETDLEGICRRNYEKLIDRQKRGVTRGSGDKR